MRENKKTSGKKYIILVVIAAVFAAGWLSRRFRPAPRLSDDVCAAIEGKITGLTNYSSSKADEVKEWDSVFSKNCRGYRKKTAAPKSAGDSAEPLPEKTCAAIESLLTEKVDNIFERSSNGNDHFERARIYGGLVESGCQENRDKYKELAVRDIEIGLAIGNYANDNGSALLTAAELYKQIGMIPQARSYVDKAKKLNLDSYDAERLRDIEKSLAESAPPE